MEVQSKLSLENFGPIGWNVHGTGRTGLCRDSIDVRGTLVFFGLFITLTEVRNFGACPTDVGDSGKVRVGPTLVKTVSLLPLTVNFVDCEHVGGFF